MTKLASPKTESELIALQRELFKRAKANKEDNKKQKFKGLIELINSEVTIMTAIHNMKSNKGSKTAGTDNKIEPILEAQFFNHSYGFRPYREAAHAVERIIYINNRTAQNYIAVEGDIKGCFDNMNHRVMIKQLWNMGIKDRRLLTIINTMLKSPIVDDAKIVENRIGLPQGGILSPLLANAYMHKLDEWVTREWELKKLRTAKAAVTTTTLKKNSTIKNPAFFVRYADDWVLITNTLKSAEYWKYKIAKYLQNNLKLELSHEKTHITNMKKKPIKFLGFKIKCRPIGQKGNYIGYSYPDDERLVNKVKELKTQLKKVRKASNLDWTVHEINILNSKIRGIMNYYSSATGVNESVRQVKEYLKYSSYKTIKNRGGKWKPANQCINLKLTYPERSEQVPAIKYNDEWYGILNIGFATWEKVNIKNQEETPFTQEGVAKYMKRTNKVPLKTRVQELINSDSYGKYIKGKSNPRKRRLYNFEYYMNRCYAFNRDKGKCKICGFPLSPKDTETHHINYQLPNEKVNKITNLATVCTICHENIHKKNIDKTKLNLKTKQIDKLNKYRQIIQDIKSCQELMD